MGLLTVEDILGALEGAGLTVRRVGRGYVAHCPAHHDVHPSLGFGDGADGAAYLKCHAGCRTADVVRALGANGTAVPLSAEELERRRAEEEAERNARTARARALHEAALAHPDRRPALEVISPPLRWDADDLLARGVGWDGERVVFPVAVDDAVIGVELYAAPGTRARALVDEWHPKLRAVGRRSLWPEPAAVEKLKFLAEGSPAAATLNGCGFPAVAYPNAAGVRRVDAERLAAAGADDLVVLADADEAGRKAARVSVLTLRGAGVHARAVDLFDGADHGRDVADELRGLGRDDGVGWLNQEIDELGEAK